MSSGLFTLSPGLVNKFWPIRKGQPTHYNEVSGLLPSIQDDVLAEVGTDYHGWEMERRWVAWANREACRFGVFNELSKV